MIDDIRLSGANTKHRQPSKTIYAERQKKFRGAKRQAKFVLEYNEATVNHNMLQTILERNKVVENKIIQKTSLQLLWDSEIKAYYCLSDAKLKDFIHVQKFTGNIFKSLS